MKTMIFGLAVMAVGIVRYLTYPKSELGEWDGILRIAICAAIAFVGFIVFLTGAINALIRSRRRDKMKLRELKKQQQS